MATCNINELLAEVAGAQGLTGGQRRVVIAKLLYDIAGETASVLDVLSSASCFLCLTQAQLKLIQAQLLCNISGGSGGGGGGCGGQVSSVTLAQLDVDSLEITWTPTNQGISLTIEQQINGGAWTTVDTGVSDALGSYDAPSAGISAGDTVIVRIYRDGTATTCAVESNEIEFLEFGDFPNDSFESYTNGQNVKDRNGGEQGDDGSFIILWESDYKVYPYGDDVIVTSPDGVLNLVQWVSADTITGVDPEEALDTWEDQTANNNDFTAVGAQRPTYQVNQLNGLPGVLFNDTNGVGMTGAVNQAAGNFSVIVVYRSADLADASGRRCVQGGSANWLIGPYAQVDSIYTGGGFLNIGYPSINPLVAAIVQTGTASLRGFLNGALAGIGTSGLVQPGLINLGGTGDAPNEPANCHIFEVAVYNRALTDEEVLGISWALMFKWGIASDTGFDT